MPQPNQYNPKSYFEKQKLTLEKKFILKQFRDNPEKVIEFLHIKDTLWRKLRNEIPNKAYEKSAIVSLHEQYNGEKRILDTVVQLGLVSKNPYAIAAVGLYNVTSVTLDVLAEGEKADRIKAGKDYLSKPENVEALNQLLDQRGVFNEAMAQGLQSATGDLRKAYEDAIVRESNFLYGNGKGDIGIPLDLDGLIQGQNAYEQLLFADGLVNFLKADTRENNPAQLEKIEKELKEYSKKFKGLEDKLGAFIKAQDDARKEEIEEHVRQLRISDYKGYAQLLGQIVSINNPKLGSAITQGTSSLVDAYEAFSKIKMNGNTLTLGSAAQLTTGVGAVFTVISILQGLGAAGEEDGMSALMAGINRINENVNQLRDEMKENFKATFELLETAIANAKIDFDNTSQLFEKTYNLISEYTKRDLESDFQIKSNEIYMTYDQLSVFSTKSEVYSILNSLFIKGIFDASVEKYTRKNETTDSLYEYLDANPKVKNDAFRWSPIENRPVLLINLVNEILSVDVDARFVGDYDLWFDTAYAMYYNNPPLKKTEVIGDNLQGSPVDSKDVDPYFVSKYYEVLLMEGTDGADGEVVYNLRKGFRLIDLIYFNDDLKKSYDEYPLRVIQDKLASYSFTQSIDMIELGNITIDLVNPVLCASATRYFAESFQYAYLFNEFPFNENYLINNKYSLFEKFGKLFNANVWFSTCAQLCGDKIVLEMALKKYLHSAERLHKVLFDSLAFRDAKTKEQVDNLKLHNQFNSAVYIDQQLTIHNYFIPDIEHYSAAYEKYLEDYKPIIEKYSKVFNLLPQNGDQAIVSFAKLNGVAIDKDGVNLYPPTGELIKDDKYTPIEVVFNLADPVNDFLYPQIKVTDVRIASILQEQLEFIIPTEFYPASWATFRIKYLDYIGKGYHKFFATAPIVDGVSIRFVHFGYKYIQLSKGLFQEDLRIRLLGAMKTENLVEHFVGLEQAEVQASLVIKAIEPDYTNVDLEYLGQYIAECKTNWLNLSTAIQLHCAKLNDYRSYEILLSNRPKIFSGLFKDENLLTNITGEELERIYLLPFIRFNNRPQGAPMSGAIGLRIERQSWEDFSDNESERDEIYERIYWMKDSDISSEEYFALDETFVYKLLDVLGKITSDPLVMPSATQSCDEAIEKCQELANMLFLQFPDGLGR